MSGRTDPPDWLDELYREGEQETPPPELDEQIRAAAHRAAGPEASSPWYRQPAKMAIAATLLLAAGVTTLWIGSSRQQELVPGVTVTSSPAKVTAEVTVMPRRSADADSDVREQASRKITPAATAADFAAAAERQSAPASPPSARLAQKSTRAIAAAAQAEADVAVEEQAAACTSVPSADSDPAQAYQLCQGADTLTVDHADCVESYLLDSEATEIGAAEDGLTFILSGRVQQLRCSQGTWRLTDPTRSEQ